MEKYFGSLRLLHVGFTVYNFLRTISTESSHLCLSLGLLISYPLLILCIIYIPTCFDILCHHQGVTHLLLAKLHKSLNCSCLHNILTSVNNNNNNNNLAKTITNKQNKYQDLANEICALWKQNTAQVIPFVIASMGAIPKSLSQSLKNLTCIPIRTYKCKNL
jgi:hypothetical protein